MALSDLNDLDFNNVGAWPPIAKVIAVILVIAGVGAAGYYFDTKDLIKELEDAQRQEITLKQEFEKKQKVVANYNQYKKQLEELEALFESMLKQLPTKTDMPKLLDDISDTGKTNGLAFELFKPQGDQPQEFYIAKPISIRARATYHQFADFVSSIAALPRIVTLEQAVLAELPGGGGDDSTGEDILIIDAILQTYRYREADEGADDGSS